jgi:hypothetical protein
VAGVVAHIGIWKESQRASEIPFPGEALKKMLLDVFSGRRLLRGDVAAGMMHLFIFWGFLFLFIGTCILAIHRYLISFLHGTPYLIFSLTMEMGASPPGRDCLGPGSKI